MAFKKKNKKIFEKLKNIKKKPQTPKFKKMFVYFIIANYGYSDSIMKGLREYDSNVQLVCLGQGTAKKEVMNMLGLGSSNKCVIMAFVDETNIHDIKKHLDTYFHKNKRSMGFGFSIQISSIVGEKMYHFLTNSL